MYLFSIRFILSKKNPNWIGQFLFLFSVLDFLIFQIILFYIFKLDFVFNFLKFGFRNFQSKQRTYVNFLKNLNSKQKKTYPNKAYVLIILIY